MESMIADLRAGDTLLADYYAAIGAQLLSSAQKGEISCFDFLIPAVSDANRKQAYQREAFLCLQESK